MSTPYVGEIRIFAGNFAPQGWMFCEGQLLPISENDTLFALIGTTYGGDGQNTFALPDLRGRLPMHCGNDILLAQSGGVEEVTLTVNQVPAHSHAMSVSNDIPTLSSPQNNCLGQSANKFFRSGSPSTTLASGSISAQGGSQPHSNFQPYLCVNFIISLFGIFPSQS
ncbi:MAG: phage tail protein [Gammaproteobacteria bacterium]